MSGMQGGSRRLGSAQDATYRWLKQYIGRLPRHGGTFLTEAEVAEATGTSRTPVREALLRLEAEGFLQIMPKKGAFVPPISDAEVQAVMQARELIEDWCVRRVTPASERFLGELAELVASQEQVTDDPVAFIERDRAFHRALVRQAGNPVLAEFYETLRERQMRMGLRAVATGADRARAVLAEHSAIIEGIRTGEPTRARDALVAHLSSTLRVLTLPDVARWAEQSPVGLT